MEARGFTRFAAGLLMMGALTACQRKPPDLTPEGAVRELLDRLDRVSTDPTEARAAYDLLSSQTRQNLIERARQLDFSGRFEQEGK